MPEPALWVAIGGGDGLRRLLAAFYRQVYDDPRLSPFFIHVTLDHAVENQYSLLRQLFTGEQIHFGDWSVDALISDELLDYRKSMMMACLLSHGVPEEHAARWGALEEGHRTRIAKTALRPKRVRHEEVTPEGWYAIELPIAAPCERCRGEIDVGQALHYHVRTGRGVCPRCYAQGGRGGEAKITA